MRVGEHPTFDCWTAAYRPAVADLMATALAAPPQPALLLRFIYLNRWRDFASARRLVAEATNKDPPATPAAAFENVEK
jgi:hypothetical protein